MPRGGTRIRRPKVRHATGMKRMPGMKMTKRAMMRASAAAGKAARIAGRKAVHLRNAGRRLRK